MEIEQSVQEERLDRAVSLEGLQGAETEEQEPMEVDYISEALELRRSATVVPKEVLAPGLA